MAKIKMTRKAITQNFGNIRCAGFCDLQNLLSNHEPGAYTCGVYGWNFDVYDVHGVTLCTGYRRMPGKRAEGIEEYEAAAARIRRDGTRTYEERQKASSTAATIKQREENKKLIVINSTILHLHAAM